MSQIEVIAREVGQRHVSPVKDLADDEADFTVSPGEWHLALLGLAGGLADDLISSARDRLAKGEQVAVAQAVASASAAGRIPLSELDVDLLRAELTAAGLDTDLLEHLPRLVADDFVTPSTPWLFTPSRSAQVGHGDDAPTLLDLTHQQNGHAALDPIDQAAIEAVTTEPAVAGLWRAWRHSPGEFTGLPPRRVFVLTAEPDTDHDDLPLIASRLQSALAAAGEATPQVELCPSQFFESPYQETARDHAALLWARRPSAGLELAQVYDVVDPLQGPGFAPDHPTIEDDDERERLLDYLDVGRFVNTSTTMMEDILDPERPQVVSFTYRTDGHWIWTDAIGYYLEKYRLAPESGLLAHLRDAPPLPPPVHEVDLHRVLAFLQRPDNKPAWMR